MTPTSTGLRRAGTSAKEMWDQRVVIRVKHLLGLIVVLFVIFGLITFQVGSLFDSSRRSDLQDVQLAAYQGDLNTYQAGLYQHDACLARIESRLIDRERFTAANLTLRAVIDAFDAGSDDPRFATVYSILDSELEAITNTLPLLNPSICPETPTQPAPPTNTEGD